MLVPFRAIKTNKSQSHLALGGITVNMLFWGRGSCMGSSTVPLYTALLSSVYSNHSAICNGLAAICNANFDWVPTPNPLHMGRPGLSNTMILATTWVSLPNGIRRPKALEGFRNKCDRWTYRQTDHATITSIAIGGIAEYYKLVIMIIHILLKPFLLFPFYPRDAMLARVFATATCPDVCPSVQTSVTRRYCA